MGFFNSWFGNNNVIAERLKDGTWTFDGVDINGNSSDDFLKASLTNPVLMAVFNLRCKLYSQMKITHVNSKGEEIKDSQYIKLLSQPNYFQTQEDFLFQQMWFLSATGTDYCYKIQPISTQEPKALYNLVPNCLDFNKTEKVNKFITLKNDKTDFENKKIKYTLDDKIYEINIKDLIPFYDLSNGIKANTFLYSNSRLEALKDVLANIEMNIQSKGVNLAMSSKYIVSPDGDGNEAQIHPNDRNDITTKLGRKSLIITNRSIKATHLVTDMKKLFLDEQFTADATTILNAYDQSKDILNYSLNGASTYDNKAASMIDYIQNSIQQDANKTMSSFSSSFGLIDKGEKLVASYSHLPALAKVTETKINTYKLFQETIKLALENGTIDGGEARRASQNLFNQLGL